MDQELSENQPKADPRLTDGQAPWAELKAMSKKIDEIYKLTNKTYKLFLWTMIVTAVTFILPLIALAFVIPFFLKTLNSTLGI